MKTFLAELFMCSLVLHIPKVRIPIAACFLLTQLVAVQMHFQRCASEKGQWKDEVFQLNNMEQHVSELGKSYLASSHILICGLER